MVLVESGRFGLRRHGAAFAFRDVLPGGEDVAECTPSPGAFWSMRYAEY